MSDNNARSITDRLDDCVARLNGVIADVIMGRISPEEGDRINREVGRVLARIERGEAHDD